jgi:hypothetical protein
MSEPSVTPNNDSSKGPQEERRAAARYPIHRSALCRSIQLADSEIVPVWVRDISLGGIGMRLERGYDPNTFLMIYLDTTTGRRVLELLARVVHATELVDDTWLIGCEFVTRLTQDQLYSLW